MVAGRQREIRRLRFSVDLNIIEHSAEHALGRQKSGNALERSEVGPRECIVALHRSLARFISVPRSKLAVRLNFSDRSGICQSSVKFRGLFRLKRHDIELMKKECKRGLVICSQDIELCV